MSGKLTDGFKDIIELHWSELVAMEKNLNASNFDSIITGVARACKKSNLRSIQMALDRLDGKVAMEVEVEYPKFYTIYPYATMKADDPSIIELDNPGPRGEEKKFIQEYPSTPEEAAEVTEEELPTGSLRAVLNRMLERPKSVVSDILATSDLVDEGILTKGDPLVKSVIIAGLMKLVHDGRINAVFEVFDQIDGKVADKIKILGGDVYLTRYDTVAPAGAEKNENGIYQLAADNTTNIWAARLEQGRKNR